LELYRKERKFLSKNFVYGARFEPDTNPTGLQAGSFKSTCAVTNGRK
jgi:hypothetical protein